MSLFQYICLRIVLDFYEVAYYMVFIISNHMQLCEVSRELQFAGKREFACRLIWKISNTSDKVIHPKYSKHLPYTMASTIDCVWSKMLNRGLNHGSFLSLFKLIPCPIHWTVYVLAYSNIIFEFSTRFSTAQNGPLCPDT